MEAADDPIDGDERAAIASVAPPTDAAEAAFRAAYDAHLPDIWRYVRRRTDGAEDADDATAEVFAVAWRRREDLPPAEETRLWLYGVARRVLANHHRSAERRRRLHLRVAGAAATRTDRGPDPADVATGSTLWRALATLDEDDRELLLLRSWDGLAVTDLAVLLGCTPNAASLRLDKARRRLRSALASAGADGLETDPSGSRTSLRRTPSPRGARR